MSYQILDKNIYKLKLDSMEFTVFVYLQSCCFNEEMPNQCFPSMNTIKENIQIGRRQLQRTLERLEYAGLITISKRKRSRGRPVNLYYVKDIKSLTDEDVLSIQIRLGAARENIKAKGKIPQGDHSNLPQGDRSVDPGRDHITIPQIGFTIDPQGDRNINKGKVIIEDRAEKLKEILEDNRDMPHIGKIIREKEGSKR